MPVGSKAANGFGLFDMGGNLWEWCLDTWSNYGTERAGDGLRPTAGDGSANRCNRGGLFGYDPGSAQSSDRDFFGPSLRSFRLGLRPARTSRL
jgi:formylglycine-generating enzyme required for sulfatase activity